MVKKGWEVAEKEWAFRMMTCMVVGTKVISISWVVPPPRMPVANEGLYIGIPDPKNVMSSWW